MKAGICMVRAAALVSGDGSKLQSVLDAIYFKEIQDLDLVAVISTTRDCNAVKRAESFKVPTTVVDPELFPTATSHSMAVANKLRDMDIDLVILSDYQVDLGVIPYQYKGKIIGSYPSLIPAFDNIPDGDIFKAAIDRGIKLTGATVYFADNDGRVGPIILQKAVEIHHDDTSASLMRRISVEAECVLLPQAIKLFVAGKLSVIDGKVRINAR